LVHGVVFFSAFRNLSGQNPRPLNSRVNWAREPPGLERSGFFGALTPLRLE
jgi:hypothetical protein